MARSHERDSVFYYIDSVQHENSTAKGYGDPTASKSGVSVFL